ncbi:Coenzyme F420 hydrogenase/dehydrogenase, beta subunit C-terminal domain [Zoogloea sp.]|uniref:Coenzyme F420 hydrogenase/dehydrogenase, beta subunit C-terminal domain n=1 Tax=Zoogloea sp. TaxID=49181 RepID=UPI00141683FD|nr:MAG: hypothetical protein F9K15_19780 [Zoogloea sp.]
MAEVLNSLARAIEADLCSGCGLCEGLLGASRVSLKIDSAGYLRPVLGTQLSPGESTLFESVCPGLNVSHPHGTKGHDPIWGPMLSAKIAAAADPEIRHQGSSGGVLSALQIHLLETGAVDYVVNVSVSDDDPFRNDISLCRTREEVLRSAGSRYAPSAPLSRIGELLDGDGRFAFVGKPCDVAALRRLAEHDPRVNQKVPVMLSFMCAGVPSIKGTHRIIEKLGARVDDVSSFRYRGDGWPGYAKATLKDGSTRSMTYEDSWKNILSPYVQWRCKLCPDGTGELADITGADAWHVNADGSPDFSEREGRSFVLLRTAAGKGVFESLVSSNGAISLGDVTSVDIEGVQFHQAYRKKTYVIRRLALVVLGRAFPQYNLSAVIAMPFRLTPFAAMRAFVGTLRRAWRKRQET